MLRRLSLAAALCLVASFAAAQEFPQPGPEHKKLQETVGEWDAVMDMNGQKSNAKATYKSVCGGMWLASDFEGDFGGLKFQGHGLDGYDQTKKKHVAIWVDSMSSAPLHMEGTYDARGKVLTMTGESTDPEGNPQKFKTTTESKDKDHMTFKMYMVEGGQEQLTFTIEYSRRK